jgi:hypothetical protein
VHLFFLVAIIALFLFLSLYEDDTKIYLQLIIGFYPLTKPVISNLQACKKASKNCVKICADIDNYFADGDTSYERLARFHYYVQTLEFEMLQVRPILYKFLTFTLKKRVKVLIDGVTLRFNNAILELKKKNLMLNLSMAVPTKTELITRHDYTLEELEAMKKKNQMKQKQNKEMPKETKTVEAPKTTSSSKKAETKKKETKPKASTSLKKPKATTAKKESKVQKQKGNKTK